MANAYSTDLNDTTTGSHGVHAGADAPTRRVFTTTETKPSYKTTELIAYVVVALGILVASAITDGQDFGAQEAWFYVTLLTVGYLVSRGLAKSGSYEKEHHTNS